MTLTNQTVNQHYLSQVEQRLNASNVGAAARNQKIHSFEILQRGSSAEIRLGPASSKSIVRNLALEDVFSFDIARESHLRQNFEALFARYERLLLTHTQSLIAKIELGSSDIHEELLGIFAAKLLNFMRNPYSVPKILNTFKGIADHRPTDPEQERLFGLVLSGRKPHQTTLCKFLGITDHQYRQWLATLFMMLADLRPNQTSLFDDLVQQLFLDKKNTVGVMICRYTKDKCLLSDRSFSTHTQSHHADGFDFNLRHDAFIRYFFANRADFLPPGLPAYVRERSESLNLGISVLHLVDDMEQLRGFNMNVINQSFRRVYCSVAQGILY